MSKTPYQLNLLLRFAIAFALTFLTAPSLRAAEPQTLTLFKSGRDGYHTYRIPALLRTTNGTLLAFCEGRKDGAGDSGRIDLLLKRSTDAGETWTAQSVVWSDGANVCGNPAPVLDENTGTIWLLMTWNLATDTERMIMEGTSRDTRRVFITRSTDNGISWTKPRDITDSVKKPHWRWYATGPGNGIQLKHAQNKGRLVIPANHSDHSNPQQHPYRAHVIYSDDDGKTWHIGGVEEDRTNESALVELGDGTLLHNMRSYHGQNRRAIARSADGGLSWSKVTLDSALIDPVCQASMIAIPRPREGSVRILFANPASTKRERMTVRQSNDDGKSWQELKVLHAGPSAYSALAALPGNSFACLFEAGETKPYEKLLFTRLELR